MCAVPDTVAHRVGNCRRYTAQHDACRWALDLWQILPTCLTHHLLSPTCPLHLELRRYLYGLSFTDGSGFSSGLQGLIWPPGPRFMQEVKRYWPQDR